MEKLNQEAELSLNELINRSFVKPLKEEIGRILTAQAEVKSSTLGLRPLIESLDKPVRDLQADSKSHGEALTDLLAVTTGSIHELESLREAEVRVIEAIRLEFIEVKKNQEMILNILQRSQEESPRMTQEAAWKKSMKTIAGWVLGVLLMDMALLIWLIIHKI